MTNAKRELWLYYLYGTGIVKKFFSKCKIEICDKSEKEYDTFPSFRYLYGVTSTCLLLEKVLDRSLVYLLNLIF